MAQSIPSLQPFGYSGSYQNPRAVDKNIDPRTDMTEGLQGIQDVIDKKELKAEEKSAKQEILDKFAEMKTAGEAALATGDPEIIDKFMRDYPEAKDAFNIADSYAHRNERTKNNALANAYRFLETEGMEGEEAEAARDAIMEDRYSMLEKEGVPLDRRAETEQFAQVYNDEGFEAAKKVLQTRLITTDNDNWQKYKEAKDKALGVGEDSKNVLSSTILENGTTIQSLKSGGTAVYSPEGTKLEGDARTKAIKAGRKFEVENARNKSSAKENAVLRERMDLQYLIDQSITNAKNTAEFSNKAFDRVDNIRANNLKMRDVIRLVKEEGAETGVIASRLPSFRSAAQELDNLQGRLGLEVVQNTTFGSLSEAELAFALSTALPLELEGVALIEWAEEKIRVQEKLSTYLEAAALYTSQPGHTRAGWTVKKRAEQTHPIPTATALNHLRENPNMKSEFIKMYGYIPERMQ